MGTFPPQPHRWAMEFYYPNRTNDFWRVMGIIFFNDPLRLYTHSGKEFNQEAIIRFLTAKGIALSDTGHTIRRLKGNASDKFLEIVQPVDLDTLLRQLPECTDLATTGEKAAITLADLTHTQPPTIGQYINWTAPSGHTLRIWRMPSTSRAYPLSAEKKADAYRQMFATAKIT